MNYQISNLLYYGLPMIGLAITSLAQILITSNYSKYKQVASRSRKTGKEVAREILDKHGLKNVSVQEVQGNLTDHYDPTKKVVRLSSDIYSGTSIASVSVAAHECGHAIQDKIGYTPMRIRSKIVHLVNFSTKIGYIVIMIGLIMGALKIALIGLILLLVYAFGGTKNVNLKNFARSYFCFLIIVAVIMFITFSVAGISSAISHS